MSKETITESTTATARDADESTTIKYTYIKDYTDKAGLVTIKSRSYTVVTTL